MDKLGLVLALVLVAMGCTAALVRAHLVRAHGDGRARALDADTRPLAPRLAVVVVSLLVGWALFRVAASAPLEGARVRVASCASAWSFGVAIALACGLVRARLVGARDASSTDALRIAAASSVVPLLASVLGTTLLTMLVARGGVASLAVLPRILPAFALGVGIVVLVGEGGGAAVLVAVAYGVGGTIAASSVAVRSASELLAVGLDPLALSALPLALQAQAALCTLVGAMATRSDPDEPPEAPRVRGLSVVVASATLAAASGAFWWGGHAGFLGLAAVVGAIAAWLALLAGRYYDDPTHRPRRMLARARAVAPFPSSATWAGTAVGAEGGVALVAIASLAIFGAHRSGALVSIPGAGILGVAVAAAVVSAASAYLDALAIVDAGAVEARAQTLAHDVVSISFAAYLLLATVHTTISGREWVVGAIVGVLVVGGYLAVGLRGAPRAAVLVLIVPALFAGVASGPGRAALVTAAWCVVAIAQLAAIVLERTATARADACAGDARPIDGSILRLRALAGACPALAATFALAAATVVASVGS